MDFGFHHQRSLFSRRIGIDPRTAHVETVVEKEALGHVSLSILRSSPASIIPILLHIHSSIIYHSYIILLTG